MEFREIDKSNYWDCMALTIDDTQEGFVADNKQSLVEAAYEDGLYTLGIYHEEMMVGFVLYDYDETFPGWSMSRFMIGKQFQGKGYGKQAAIAFIEYFKSKHEAAGDAADLHEIFGDDETMENCEPAYDYEKTKEFLTSFCIGRKGAVAAVHKESSKVIGYILFNQADEGVYEMGWIYNRSFWRQGYAYESCKAVIDYAFTELNAHKVFAEAIDAKKSVALMQKLGMKLEGVQRSQTKDNQMLGG